MEDDEPIVDPGVPERVRWQIIGAAASLDRSGEPASEARRFHLGGGVVAGAIGAFLAGVAMQSDSQIAAVSAVLLIAMAGLFAGAARRSLAVRLRRVYGDCYVIPADLDAGALDLVRRARRAIERVSASRVHRLGLLGDAAGEAVLQESLWNIARLLRAQVALRAEHEEAAGEVMTPS
ncbi:hypothetical protein Misp01_21230 [Microtetraspora sp. NBRC 13810]|uniref:hypothetical protein n=1 Tax=Microtetraspora sp. NBRC 13810 TaxID=3030990 RepID=UPI0024A2D456|nr:hypothetical protein [Microtetraspora sp. NBRC 13810]GLW06993.1 hypothetical protein Misp01_21230 [Microtetraspora sp. NBRC 13810]